MVRMVLLILCLFVIFCSHLGHGQVSNRLKLRDVRLDAAAECIYDTGWTTCGGCLSIHNNTWCGSSSKCFSITNATNAVLCQTSCSRGLESDHHQCSQETVSIVAVVFSFIILIICPLCIISGCIYVAVFKCRGSAKVGISPNIPIPGHPAPQPLPCSHLTPPAVLEVHNAPRQPIAFAEIPAMAEVEVIATSGRYHSDVPMTSAVPLATGSLYTATVMTTSPTPRSIVAVVAGPRYSV